ncbi:unnamed protein product [Acanthoscelides obtectus]|uniref:Uncharacterized protein n=1 Tax=Acanthoscelides obtectus TaxID=200917 RepID=A0A9P0KJH7_ACAOB|nr:unnamed protein product [Acanthoscelides obtectus]CAK1662896.1 hypothetical protein AOBTE_LOCUS23372 [Acanthoscelides obtectus]
MFTIADICQMVGSISFVSYDIMVKTFIVLVTKDMEVLNRKLLKCYDQQACGNDRNFQLRLKECVDRYNLLRDVCQMYVGYIFFYNLRLHSMSLYDSGDIGSQNTHGWNNAYGYRFILYGNVLLCSRAKACQSGGATVTECVLERLARLSQRAQEHGLSTEEDPSGIWNQGWWSDSNKYANLHGGLQSYYILLHVLQDNRRSTQLKV